MYDDLWQALEQEAAGGPSHAIALRRVQPDSGRDLFVGIEKPGLNRIFLLRVPRDLVPAPESLPDARGVEFRALVLPQDGDHHASLVLTLKDVRATDIFSALVADLAQKLAATESNAAAVSVFASRLQRWQRFLAERSFPGLTDEAQRGLYGELTFLRRHVLPLLGPRGALAWTGARHTPQDYQFVDCAVEVKTSIANQLQTLRITNERQLDDSHVAHLFLYHLSLNEMQGTGETLVDAVAALRDALAGDAGASEAFETALLDAGYLDAHAVRYAASGLTVREENLFRVTQGFPRIVEDDLCNGVGNVQYSISVAECRQFAVHVAELTSILELRP